jgi:hypothetical protein
MSGRVKEAIEEMIEESYLLGLSEQEIRKDFKRFIDACYAVIQENVKDRSVVSELAKNLAREQTVILIADRAEASGPDVPAAAPEDSPVEEAGVEDPNGDDPNNSPADAKRAAAQEFSEKVARRKRQILRTIAQHDPQLVRLIDAHRFQGEGAEPRRPAFPGSSRKFWRKRNAGVGAGTRVDWPRVRLQLLKVGYATTIALIVALIWLGFTQNSF